MRFQGLELKQRHSLSQSAPTILVYQVGLIFFQDPELKKGPKYELQGADCKKRMNYTLTRDTLVSW